MKNLLLFVSIMTLFLIACQKPKDDLINLTLPTEQQSKNSFHSFRTYYPKQYKVSKGLDSNGVKLGDTIQYVKFVSYYSEDNKQVNVYEIEAYCGGQNIALNKSATASSTNWDTKIERINDGDYLSRWSSDRNDTTKAQFITIDLTKKSLIDSIRLYLFQSGVGADTITWYPWRQTFTLYTSKNLIKLDSIGGGVNVNYLNW